MCWEWMNEKIKRLTWVDYGAVKICVFAFALMLAKLWAPILNLPWYWYGAVFAVTWVYLIWKFFWVK